MIKQFISTATALFLLLGIAAATPPPAAEKSVRAAVADVLAIAERATDSSSLAANLRPVLVKYLSFDAMTRRAIGPGWRQFTPAQKKKAIDLFTTLIIRTYANKFTPGQHPAVTFKTATEPAPGRVEVPTTLIYQGKKYSVVYRVEAGEGMQITDVVIEGVSLVANYRSQFDAEFKNGGADSVLNSLTKTVARPK